MGFSSFDGGDFKFGSPDPGHPLEDQLAAWAREAASARRVACVYLTASWCPPSVKLEKSLGNPLMANALRGVNFVTYDIDDSASALAAAGFPAHTVPVFYVLDESGKRTGPSITGGAWGENTPENMAPPLEKFFDAARAEVAARPGVSMPDPQLIGAMVASSAAARSEVEQPAAASSSAPAQPVANAPSSIAPRLIVVCVVLLVLALVHFALMQAK